MNKTELKELVRKVLFEESDESKLYKLHEELSKINNLRK